MLNAIITLKGRKKLLRARAGEILLPRISKFAFGSGGVDASGNVISPLETQETLSNELLRKDIESHKFVSDTVCRYECTLLASELIGANISEIALVDEEGDCVAIKNFKAKGKDEDLEMTFDIDDEF